jgi:S-adenosylmethionine:tRNA ribosyltransferase-isomerase
VYSKKEGAVAAPTAGLHFTPAVLEVLQKKGIQLEELTLHVSAGTFRPVKSANALEHDMHSEQVIVRRSTIEALLQPDRPVIAVGTTSMRTLESLYWFGVALLGNPEAAFVIEQSTAFEAPAQLPSKQEALQAVMDCLERRQLSELFGSTQIYITPGYNFHLCEGLMTNFHQPGSTLMLLVAAFTGGQSWRDIYQTALTTGYRFLSYGDSSLLWRGNNT